MPLPVKAIYWTDPNTGLRWDIHRYADGCFVLVDAQIPYRAPDGRKNWRNMSEVAVRIPSLERAAYLIESLRYRPRMLVNGKTNYVPAAEVTIQR